jgi:hypothetical protein
MTRSNLTDAKLYKIVSLFNYELRHDVWRNAGKTPGVLVPALRAKVQVVQ